MCLPRPKHPRLFAALCSATLCSAALLSGSAGSRLDAQETPVKKKPAARRVDFERDVRPILEGRCHECHGADRQERGLRLDRRSDALSGGDSGPVWVPGKSGLSLLIKYVTGENDDEITMPPNGDSLSKQEIDLLKRWIDEGANWPEKKKAEQPTRKEKEKQ